MLSTADFALRASLRLVYAAAIAGRGSRRAPRCSPARATGGAPRPSTCSSTGGPARAIYALRLCRSQTDSPSSTDVLRALTAESDRALAFLGSSHDPPGLLGSPRDVLRGGRSRPNTREIKSPSVDLGPLACVQGLPAHDHNTTNHLVLVAPTTCPSTTRWKLPRRRRSSRSRRRWPVPAQHTGDQIPCS